MNSPSQRATPKAGEAPIIRVRGLVFRRGRKTILDGIDLDIPRGAMVAFMGPSGAGKTTMLQLISGRGILPYDNLVNPVITDPAEFGIKLTKRTDSWGAGVDNSIVIDAPDPGTYDMRIDLGPYRVYTKIVDAAEGNSGGDEGLLKTAVVNSGSGEVVVMSIPYLYTIEVLSQSPANPVERSKLSALYQY